MSIFNVYFLVVSGAGMRHFLALWFSVGDKFVKFGDLVERGFFDFLSIMGNL